MMNTFGKSMGAAIKLSSIGLLFYGCYSSGRFCIAVFFFFSSLLLLSIMYGCIETP
jgi:hypothetical protein